MATKPPTLARPGMSVPRDPDATRGCGDFDATWHEGDDEIVVNLYTPDVVWSLSRDDARRLARMLKVCANVVSASGGKAVES